MDDSGEARMARTMGIVTLVFLVAVAAVIAAAVWCVKHFILAH